MESSFHHQVGGLHHSVHHIICPECYLCFCSWCCVTAPVPQLLLQLLVLLLLLLLVQLLPLPLAVSCTHTHVQYPLPTGTLQRSESVENLWNTIPNSSFTVRYASWNGTVVPLIDCATVKLTRTMLKLSIPATDTVHTTPFTTINVVWCNCYYI